MHTSDCSSFSIHTLFFVTTLLTFQAVLLSELYISTISQTLILKCLCLVGLIWICLLLFLDLAVSPWKDYLAFIRISFYSLFYTLRSFFFGPSDFISSPLYGLHMKQKNQVYFRSKIKQFQCKQQSNAFHGWIEGYRYF